MLLVWLDHPRCRDVALTGGKAANLAHLADEYAVPPGFCLTTEAYQHWAGGATQAVPDQLRELLATAYTRLAEQSQVARPRVAVRSSAVDEDSQDASFAGQYETYLNVVGGAAVCDAVARCWAAAQSERLRAYRQQQGNARTETPLAVLVQWLVPADSSFVAFSANPINGRQNEVVINANWGLGESIVSGLTAADTYVVSKTEETVLARIVADKRAMTVLAEQGVKTVNVPRLLREKAVLEEEKTMTIARLATQLEKQMGWPVDIEGAFHGDQLYLLQCRPISTLAEAGGGP